MNFDVARDNELRDHLSGFECECEDGEICDACDPVEWSLRQDELRDDLREK